MKRFVAVGVVVATVAVAFVAFAQPTGAPHATSPTAIEPRFFDHKDHAALATQPVIMTGDKQNCATCHKVDPKGAIEVPGANGHAPCMSSGCHDSWFLAAGVKTDPNHDRAVGFCLGCHETTDGQAPAPWLRNRPVFRSYKAELEWHVEMPGPDDPQTQGRGSHFAHVDEKDPRQDCRSCHIVSKDSGQLETGTPGHPQCGVCHNASQRDQDKTNAAVPLEKKIRITMADCGGCHHEGARAAGNARQDDGVKADAAHVTTVRSCDSEGHDALVKSTKRGNVSCFRHDRKEHRFDSKDPSKEVQCGQCHYMLGNQSEWGAIHTKTGKPARYFTLEDIRENPIISNDQNREHKSCGSEEGQCHGPAFKANKCEKCHENMSAF